MSKSTSNWKQVVNFIKTASVEGIEAVMTSVQNRVAAGNFTDAQQEAFNKLADKDDLSKAAAKVTAAKDSGGLDNYGPIDGIISTASFADVKRYIHAVDTRLKGLPEDQRNECLSSPGDLGDGLSPELLAALMGGAPVPPEGAYMGDSDDDGSDDDDAFLDL